jgi:two-component system, response regulator PdtaR
MVVLVVEDEVIIAYCTVMQLEDAGHTVLGPARTSEEALALARHTPPDVAVIDIDLEEPGAGIGLAQQLRCEYDVVVVFTTGQSELARAHADIALGVITKPYDPAELSEIVTYAAATRRGGRAAQPPGLRSFERFERRCKQRQRPVVPASSVH